VPQARPAMAQNLWNDRRFRAPLVGTQGNIGAMRQSTTTTMATTSRKEGNEMPRRDPGPSVKDKKMYEALRDDGESKEKSARIANAAARSSRSKVGRKGGKSGDYEDWSKDQLMSRAREIGITGRSRMGKDELIQALRNH
jgi:hypothetical protein